MEKNDKKSVKNTRGMKKGTLSFIFTVVFIAAVIAFSIIVGYVSEAFPLNIDLTANKDYTMEFDEVYKDYIENISNDVNIVVCAERKDFTDDKYATQMVYSLGLMDGVNGTLTELTKKYSIQTGVFIDQFESMNKNISVSYRNIESISSFRDITEKFPDEDFEYGDILVYCDYTLEDGTKYTRHQVLKTTEIFNVTPNEQYQQYYNYGYMQEPYFNELSSSKLAGEMTSALYIATSIDTIQAAVIGGHDEAIKTDALENLLGKNNYTFTKIENLVSTEIPETAAFVVISAPTVDYTEAEIKKLDAFLDKGNKTLVYLPSVYQNELPRLEEFLIEWGIDVQKSFVLDSAQSTAYIFAEDGGSDFSEKLKDSDRKYYPSLYRLIKTTENTDATITPILTTPEENIVACPITANSEDFDVNRAEKGPFNLVLLSTMVTSSAEAESNILVISGDNFVSGEDPAYGGTVGVLENSSYSNADLTVEMFNRLSGNDTVEITITEKTINELSFVEKVSQHPAYVTIIRIVFMAVVPSILIVFAVVVFIVRKRK